MNVESNTTIWTRPILSGGRGQALTLLALSVICAAVAVAFNPGDETGLLAIAVGFLLASMVGRGRYFIAGIIALPFGLGNTLWQVGVIRLAQLEAFHLLGLGMALALIALASRRGLLGDNPFSAAALVSLVGALLLGLTTPGLGGSALLAPLYRALVTFWAPTLIFAVGGIGDLVASVVAPPRPSTPPNA